MTEWEKQKFAVEKSFQIITCFFDRYEELINKASKFKKIRERIIAAAQEAKIITEKKANELSAISQELVDITGLKQAKKNLTSVQKNVQFFIRRKDALYPLAQKQIRNRMGSQKRFEKDQARAVKYGKIYHDYRLDLLKETKDREANKLAYEFVCRAMEHDKIKRMTNRTINNYETKYLEEKRRQTQN